MLIARRAVGIGLVTLFGWAWAPLAASAPLVQKILGQSPTAPKSGPVRQTGAERLAEIKLQLQVAEQEAAADLAGKRPIPAGATAAQLSDISSVLQRLPRLLQAQLDVLSQIESARAGRAAAEAALGAWSGFERGGPFALSEYDALLDQRDAERTRISAFESVAKLQDEELVRAEALLREREAAERRALEQAVSGMVAPVELARLRKQRAAGLVWLLTFQDELNRELLQAAQARVALLDRQAAAMATNYRFTEQELERVLKGLQAQQVALERRVEDANAAQGRAAAAHAAALKAFEALASAPPAEVAMRRAELQARLDAVQATIEAARLEQLALTMLRGAMPTAMQAWVLRFQALAGLDADARRAADHGLTELLVRLSALPPYALDLGTLTDALVQDQQRRLEAAAQGSAGRRYAFDALQAARRAAQAVDELKTAAQKIAAAQTRWKVESGLAAGRRPIGARLADAWSVLKGYGATLWNFELFAIEDTVTIDGKASVVARGVTVGKSIGALLVFGGGYVLAGALLRRIERLIVSRLGVSEPQAKLLRRWLMMLMVFVLLAFTLNLARIPLTVFAFMGGALVIGIGFGTQTLLKNFISGIIVLFERKVRVGDIVEVDGVQGMVTAVDIRSTTLRQFDGIETMVPNALLLENKVTNWTGESPTMRRAVKVGVAYGSPTRQVAEILAQAAADHGQVLKEPAPLVIFEDFGDNALAFTLYFWVDLVKHSGILVQSDIRFMLEKRLTDAGISIAFPQRDLHLHSARPLQIQLMPGSVPSGAA